MLFHVLEIREVIEPERLCQPKSMGQETPDRAFSDLSDEERTGFHETGDYRQQESWEFGS